MRAAVVQMASKLPNEKPMAGGAKRVDEASERERVPVLLLLPCSTLYRVGDRSRRSGRRET